jgi:hypothetical protein
VLAADVNSDLLSSGPQRTKGTASSSPYPLVHVTVICIVIGKCINVCAKGHTTSHASNQTREGILGLNLRNNTC